MRARPPPPDTSSIAVQFEAAPGLTRLRTLASGFEAATPETVIAVLDEAARFAELHLAPLNTGMDTEGCSLVEARVRTAPGHLAAWNAFLAAGWSTLDHPEAIGGQGLPLALAMAVQSLFDRACPAFGMLPVPQRSAARLLMAHGDALLQQEWLPHLVAGDWAATICISEPDAGSDVGRIRTRAEPLEGGDWAVTGEKCWISYGDHDLAPRIGHCLLARTPGAAPGGAGLSLFLIPDQIPDEGGGPLARNAIHVRRLEHKLGLHGSPTCALGFEGARGQMIGQEGRGLAQMFVMITNMRLSVAAQGLGIASAAADTALAYARERRQGGPVDGPVPIIDHPDVQRELMDQSARVEVLRGLIFAVANHAELAAHETEPEARADSAALVQWLLPILKTTGGEYAFQVADSAIQVLGGAGYTAEWPVEQALRDARVLTLFEGTTGIQALDLLHRRLLRGDRRGLKVFLSEAHSAASACSAPEAAAFSRCLVSLETAAEALLAQTAGPRAAESGATAFLHLSALAATGWIGARLAMRDPLDPVNRRLIAVARHWMGDLDVRAAHLLANIVQAADLLELAQSL